MPRVLRTDRTETDLLEIWSYVARDNPRAADRLLDDIASTCKVLAENPDVGRLREELAGGLRSFAVGKYVVFYRPARGGIVVVRVLHGARDVQRDIREMRGP
jgi:toxin ParE1/3/4